MPDGAGLGTGSLLEARESGGTPETFSGASGSAAILRLRLRDYIYATKHTCHRLGSGSDLVDVSLSLSAAMSELNEAMKNGPDYDSSSRDLTASQFLPRRAHPSAPGALSCSALSAELLIKPWRAWVG